MSIHLYAAALAMSLMNRFVLGCAALLALSALPLHAEDCGPLKIVAQVQLLREPSGRAVFVPVEIGGVKKLMLLDTGSPISTITQEAATELGLEIKRSNARLYDVNGGYSELKVTTSIAIGSLKGGSFDFQISSLGFAPGSGVVGLLGTDILSQFDASVDLGTGKMDLLSQDHCDGRVVYWKERPLAIVRFEADQSGHIVFPINLDGVTLRAILDTGASHSALNRTVAVSRFDLNLGSADTPLYGTLNGEEGSQTWHHTFHTLTFEGVAVSNPDFAIIPDRMRKHFQDKELGSLISRDETKGMTDALLGMNVLKQLHIYIAFKERKVYITPAASDAAAQK